MRSRSCPGPVPILSPTYSPHWQGAAVEVSASSLVEVVCRFAELPPAGRYRLVLATRCGLGGKYRVVEADREVEVVAG